jgi:hypothetical protein
LRHDVIAPKAQSMLVFQADLAKNDAHVNFILTYTSVLLGFTVGIIRAALKSMCDLSASFASQSGAREDFRTAARCPQSGALQQDSGPSFGDGVMNVLEGVVGQNGGHCRKWHGWRPDNGAAWGSSAVQWPAGGRTHQWTVELRQRVRLFALAPAATMSPSFFPAQKRNSALRTVARMSARFMGVNAISNA